MALSAVVGRVPVTIDRYELVRPIGRGGMAEVFHARLQRIGGFERDVAVKVLLPEFSAESEFVEMLLDEARIAGAVNHPCIVQMLDVGQKDDLFYLVMEYVDGADLRSFLRRAPHHTLPVEASLFVVSEVLRGLHAVHTAVDERGVPRRIVHRDVSPANVLIGRNGVVKLGDFGIAHASSRLTRTRNGAIKGKLKYLSPEQITCGKVDHRADLYAVGVMLCEMLVGDAACEPKKMTPYGPVFAWSPRLASFLGPDVAEIAARALAEDPLRRFGDASQFRQKLVQALMKRAPGYGCEELTRDLAALDEGFLSEMPTIASSAVELYTDYGNPTTPQLRDPLEHKREQKITSLEQKLDQKITEPHRVLRTRQPDPPLVQNAPSMLQSVPQILPLAASDLLSPIPVAQPFSQPISVPVKLTAPMWTRRTAVWAAGAAGAAALAVAALLLIGTGSAAAPRLPEPQIAQVVVRPLAPSRVATGTLEVAGPPGASVIIGSTIYPAGRLELPPGEYQVMLRKRARGRALTRHVTIAAGAVTPIKM